MYQQKISIEGILTEHRKNIIKNSSLVRYMHQKKLHKYILVGKGTQITENIIADVFEAIIGVIDKHFGIEEVERVLIDVFIMSDRECVYCGESFKEITQYNNNKNICYRHTNYYNTVCIINKCSKSCGGEWKNYHSAIYEYPHDKLYYEEQYKKWKINNGYSHDDIIGFCI